MVDTKLKLLDDFYLFLEDYADFYSDFLILESEKYQAVSMNQFLRLDDFMKQEQVFLLKSKSFEQKRDVYLQQMSNSKLTLNELIDTIPNEEYQTKYRDIHRKLSGILQDLKEANRVCNFLIELHLHKIENRIKRMEHTPQTDQSYGPGSPAPKNAHLNISRKI
ncbi:MAG: flagellar export chaperone FlgN [Anaerofustis sp.]